MNCVRAYGLSITSASPMPGLPAVAGEADVVVRREDLGTPPYWALRNGRFTGRSDGEAVLVWGDRVTLSVRDGKEVGFDHAPDVDEFWTRQCILGPGIGVLLHQRQMIALHASAVVLGGGAVLFLGDKRSGKSTTAAALASRGHALVTDDIAALALDSGGETQILPGPPWLKLREDVTANFSASEQGEAPRDGARARWEPPVHSSDGSLPITAICSLSTGSDIRIAEMSSRNAVGALVENLYAARFLGAECITPSHFRCIARLAESIPTFSLARTTRLSTLQRFVDTVENHFC